MKSVMTHQFSQIPKADIPRSVFNRSNGIKTAFDAGYLVPIYVDEVLPGDTKTLDATLFGRLATPIVPFMDNLFLETFFFFVPYRLIWDNWQKFNGEQENPGDSTDYLIPQVVSPDAGFAVNSLADYFGLPVKVSANLSVSSLPFRAYNLIWNEWFRDENLQDSVSVPKDDITYNFPNDSTEPIFKLLKRNKRHDYFTSSLPWPQKGPGVMLQIGESAPIYGTGSQVMFTYGRHYPDSAGSVEGNMFGLYSVGNLEKRFPNNKPYGISTPMSIKSNATGLEDAYYGTALNITSIKNYQQYSRKNSYNDAGYRTLYSYMDSGKSQNIDRAYPLFFPTKDDIAYAKENIPSGNYPNKIDNLNSGIYADLSEAGAVTINALREAFQIQKLYERDARGGTRYTEILRAHFGVISPDARLQRPEYLGGGSSRININPVAQSSSTDTTTPQGNLAAYGVTASRGHGFQKSFVEHGIIIGLANVRADLNYQQGVDRFWSRKTRFDFYWPALCHLGEQAVLSKEICYTGDAEYDNTVFGYQERWSEYRYKTSHITGKLRTAANSGLDCWHLAQYFSDPPVLNAEFIQDNPPVSRVSAVQSEPAILLDGYFDCLDVRPMPVYSVPGLVDHF